MQQHCFPPFPPIPSSSSTPTCSASPRWVGGWRLVAALDEHRVVCGIPGRERGSVECTFAHLPLLQPPANTHVAESSRAHVCMCACVHVCTCARVHVCMCSFVGVCTCVCRSCLLPLYLTASASSQPTSVSPSLCPSEPPPPPPCPFLSRRPYEQPSQHCCRRRHCLCCCRGRFSAAVAAAAGSSSQPPLLRSSLRCGRWWSSTTSHRRWVPSCLRLRCNPSLLGGPSLPLRWALFPRAVSCQHSPLFSQGGLWLILSATFSNESHQPNIKKSPTHRPLIPFFPSPFSSFSLPSPLGHLTITKSSPFPQPLHSPILPCPALPCMLSPPPLPAPVTCVLSCSWRVPTRSSPPPSPSCASTTPFSHSPLPPWLTGRPGEVRGAVPHRAFGQLTAWQGEGG